MERDQAGARGFGRPSRGPDVQDVAVRGGRSDVCDRVRDELAVQPAGVSFAEPAGGHNRGSRGQRRRHGRSSPAESCEAADDGQPVHVGGGVLRFAPFAPGTLPDGADQRVRHAKRGGGACGRPGDDHRRGHRGPEGGVGSPERAVRWGRAGRVPRGPGRRAGVAPGGDGGCGALSRSGGAGRWSSVATWRGSDTTRRWWCGGRGLLRGSCGGFRGPTR